VARFYLTTAIDYANGDPHLGHAFEKIGADALARYHRLRGDDVHFLVGLDEHGQKVAQTAATRGVTPQQQVDEVAESFRVMWSRLAISYDQFIRTTDSAHKVGVKAFLERAFERSPDDYYEKAYAGWYCIGCELFKRDDEIVGGKCVLHPTRTLDWSEERNWFFRLSRYGEFIERLLRERPTFLQPDARRNEILGLLSQGLEDISISRARLTWGIPFGRPTSDGAGQVVWVWFDALPNYLTATGYPDPHFGERWPAQLHVVGKDITRLHAVVWPAMLESAGLDLPERVWGHGFVNVGGERLSKSAGAQLDLGAAVAHLGPDALRYFLLREVPFDGDGNFSLERFEERYTADLANAWGNLASRTIAMVERYFGGRVPPGTRNDLDSADERDLEDYHTAMDGDRGYLLHEALQAVWRTVARANEYVDRNAPWKLAKDTARVADLEAVLAALIRALVRHAVYLSPFMPGKTEELWEQLGAPGEAAGQRYETVGSLDPTGWMVTRGQPLFPKEQERV
jgi:methionyl-tRNA synthetase